MNFAANNLSQPAPHKAGRTRPRTSAVLAAFHSNLDEGEEKKKQLLGVFRSPLSPVRRIPMRKLSKFNELQAF